MFVALPTRQPTAVRWATPALLAVLAAASAWVLAGGEQPRLLQRSESRSDVRLEHPLSGTHFRPRP